MPNIVLIAHNIRSTHNVGSLFRSAECFGVNKIILSGYTPFPTYDGDPRLPHISRKLTNQIHKTALGTETLVPFSHEDMPPLDTLRKDGYRIVALEQSKRSIPLASCSCEQPIALLIGEEVNGIEQPLLDTCDDIIEIPQLGTKESLNVSVAAGIALYALSIET
jgi:tRNA G18 (ribose-2'-O)-methylase SpoU